MNYRIKLTANLILLLTIIASCRRDYYDSIQRPYNVNEVKEWLNTNGGIYRKETITIIDESGQKLIGRLNWEKSTQYSWNGKNYVDIPFQFEANTYLPENGTASPAAFGMVVRKNNAGEYEGAIRTIMNGAHAEGLGGPTEKQLIQSYRLINGKESNVWQNSLSNQNPVLARRKKMTAVEFSNLKLAYAASSKQKLDVKPGEKLMYMQPVCNTYSITIYDVNCYYTSPEAEANQDATCVYSPKTTYTTVCSDTWVPGAGDEGGGSGGGGSGGGGDDYPPVDPPPLPEKDPCEEIRKNNTNASDLLKGSYGGNFGNEDPMYTTGINAFHDLAKVPGNNTERSMSIKVKVRPIVEGGTASKAEMGLTDINTGTATSVYTTTSIGEGWTVMGGIHTHISSANAAPSPRDIYGFYKGNKDNASYRYQFVFSADGSRYVMSIENPEKFANFISTHPEAKYIDSTNGWVNSTSIGQEFRKIMRYLAKEQKLNNNAAYERAFAYMLKSNDTGLSLSKANSTGYFQSVFATKDPAYNKKNSIKVVSETDCDKVYLPMIE